MDGNEPPKDYHMCKKRYEDVWDQSHVLHSLCSWWANGVLCEKIADVYMCKRYMGDDFYSDVRFPEFGNLCNKHCLRSTEDQFASMFNTKGNDASAQIDNWRSTRRKPPEATTRRPLTVAERTQLEEQQHLKPVGRESSKTASIERDRVGRGRRGRDAARANDGSGHVDNEEVLRERVFAQLHEKLRRQKEEEREALGAAEEEAAAAAAAQSAGKPDANDFLPKQAVDVHTHSEAKLELQEAPSQDIGAVGIGNGQSTISPQPEPDDIVKLREAVIRHGKSSQTKRDRSKAIRQRRLQQWDSPNTPPVPFIHERASQAKIAREDAAAKAKADADAARKLYDDSGGASELTRRQHNSVNAVVHDREGGVAGIAATTFDPLYDPW